MAGSAGFNFPDSDASALANSGTDYGQNNLSAAYVRHGGAGTG